MTKINNYTELVAERIRLQEELKKQKLFFKGEINEVKTKLEPIRNVMSFLGIIKSKNAAIGPSSILKTGLSMGIDLLVRDKLLSKAGWITRAILPVIIKGISKQFINKKTPSNGMVE